MLMGTSHLTCLQGTYGRLPSPKGRSLKHGFCCASLQGARKKADLGDPWCADQLARKESIGHSCILSLRVFEGLFRTEVPLWGRR